MRKNLFFLLHSMVFIAVMASESFGQTPTKSEWLWEISHPKLTKKSYLFGSIHTNDKRVYQFTDTTYLALRDAETVVLETDLFEIMDEFEAISERVPYKLDRTGRVYTASKEATKTKYGNEDGMPQFLDAFFQQYAENTKKEVFPLESVEFQLSLLDGAFDRSLDFSRVESFFASKELMIDLYTAGDLQKISKVLQNSLNVYPELYDKLIVNRNLTMNQKLDSLLQTERQIFCAIGAGHLAGDKGVIQLLRKAGYRVRLVSATYNNGAALRKEIFSRNYFQFNPEGTTLYATLPGKPRKLESKVPEKEKYKYIEFGQGNSYTIEIEENIENYSLQDYANIYLLGPEGSTPTFNTLDDGTEYVQGLTETYFGELSHVRIMLMQDRVVILSTSGGNKYLNSQRPMVFFDRAWVEE